MRFVTLLFAMGALSSPAFADEEGIPVTLRVVDRETGLPIPTAVIRHPKEQERHRVNTETGTWTDSVLYLPDGSEMLFLKGMELEFEVSAPGYANQSVVFTVRKRKNVFEAPLDKMSVDMSSEDPEDIMIQFGRDKPID